MSEITRAHFIGIGGAGMSGIALVLHERGCYVSGSDLKNSHYVRDLEEAGVTIHIGHVSENIDIERPDVVVVSTAIPESNPEFVRARELQIPIWPRAKMLSYLGEGVLEIAVAGTHGKTTTSSMVATMLDHMGKDPAFLIGGIVEEFHTNGRDGKGGYFVCEADESDGSFMFLTPKVVIITNIEADHLDHYGTLENIENTFVQFMQLVGKDGYVVINGDNPHYLELAEKSGMQYVSYGFSEGLDFVVKPSESTHELASNFEVLTKEGAQVSMCIPQNPGRHNMANAAAALAAASVLGLDVAEAALALSSFKGAHRRFTHVGDINGICVVDDYGHHPTEIKATLAAAKDLNFKRIVSCFQPHRYSRTESLLDDFGEAFSDADVVVVTDIFSAGEAPIPGVTGKNVAKRIEASNTVDEVHFVATRRELPFALAKICKPGDLLITQGAGDITDIGPAFIEELKAQA